MDIDYVSLGKNIRKHRTQAGLTQRQLAEIVGCTDRHIGQIEIAKNIPSLEITVKIANALYVGVDRLLNESIENRIDSFIGEIVSLVEGFDAKDKKMAIEMTKAIVAVIKEHDKL